jgi:hypothetical protein
MPVIPVSARVVVRQRARPPELHQDQEHQRVQDAERDFGKQFNRNNPFRCPEGIDEDQSLAADNPSFPQGIIRRMR